MLSKGGQEQTVLLVCHLPRRHLFFSKDTEAILIPKFTIRYSSYGIILMNGRNNNNLLEEDEKMSYVDEVIASVKVKNAAEPEFIQAVEEVLESIRVVIEADEDNYRKLAFLERITEPER